MAELGFTLRLCPPPRRHLTLSQSDMAALTGGKGFPFLFQHIRDGINIRQTCNLIFSLCRYNNRLAEHVSTLTAGGGVWGGRDKASDRWLF